MIRSRAEHATRGDDRTDRALLDASFWEPPYRERIIAEWDTGDFTNEDHDGEIYCAFGVTFALADILKLVPVEKRPGIAASLSVAGDPNWCSARETLEICLGASGRSGPLSGREIIEQAKLGFVVARAVDAQIVVDVHGGRTAAHEEREWDIPEWFWQNFTNADSSHQGWQTGVFRGRGSSPDGRALITLGGVHFLKDSLRIAGLLDDAASAKAQKPKAKGGRPPIAFAEEMNNAIWRDITAGTLTPNSIADVKRAMLDWANANGHELSDSTAHDRARRLYAAYSAALENPDR